MRRTLFLFLLAACQPPTSSSRATVELYRHPNGLTNCVDTKGDRWKADATCCPSGFEPAGFSVPSVTERTDEDDIKRKLYRHLVCIERAASPAQ